MKEKNKKKFSVENMYRKAKNVRVKYPKSLPMDPVSDKDEELLSQMNGPQNDIWDVEKSKVKAEAHIIIKPTLSNPIFIEFEQVS
jgi:hypothetical protein